MTAVRTLWQLRQRFPFFKVGFLPLILHGRMQIGPALHAAHPDLVYARNPYWLAGAANDGYPFIFESHHPPRNFFDRRLQTNLFKRPEFRLLVVISEPLKKLYHEQFPELSPEQVLVAHDGADDPGAMADEPSSARKDRLRVGYVGHLYKGRGVGLIRQVALMQPDMDFYMIGGRPEDVEALKTSELPQNVYLFGHRPHAELPEHYRSFDMVLAPYQQEVAVQGNAGNTAAFMSPLKIFEYMSWGKPILASDLPAIREILEPDHNAILLPPDDPLSWSEALRKLAENQENRQNLAKNARKTFLQYHTWVKRARSILETV